MTHSAYTTSSFCSIFFGKIESWITSKRTTSIRYVKKVKNLEICVFRKKNKILLKKMLKLTKTKLYRLPDVRFTCELRFSAFLASMYVRTTKLTICHFFSNFTNTVFINWVTFSIILIVKTIENAFLMRYKLNVFYFRLKVCYQVIISIKSHFPLYRKHQRKHFSEYFLFHFHWFFLTFHFCLISSWFHLSIIEWKLFKFSVFSWRKI